LIGEFTLSGKDLRSKGTHTGAIFFSIRC
jgi:hypothetical protein